MKQTGRGRRMIWIAVGVTLVLGLTPHLLLWTGGSRDGPFVEFADSTFDVFSLINLWNKVG